MSTVELRNLGKVYPNGHRAVHDVDLDIPDGEFFVILGPSGCGKTSVLRMIAGLEEITFGDVLVDGTSISGVKTNERDLAMLFQAPTLYPHMSVAENLGFPLRMAHIHKQVRDNAVAEVADLLGLSELLDRRPRQLSGGQQQRVAMGRAMVREPELMLMDEPMSNLDAKLRTDLRSVLVALQHRFGVTTIYVTHDQIEAMSMGDRIAVMRRGAVVQCAPPAVLYDQPVDVFVAQFVGATPMNLFRGSVTRLDDELAVDLGQSVHALGATTEGRFSSLADRLGDSVIVGVRPEAFHRCDDGPIVMDVTSVEWQGPHVVAHGTIEATGVEQHDAAIVTLEGHGAHASVMFEGFDGVNRFQALLLDIDVARIHLFDPETGRSLT